MKDYQRLQRVDTGKEALVVSLNEIGRVDWPARNLTGKSIPALQTELTDSHCRPSIKNKHPYLGW